MKNLHLPRFSSNTFYSLTIFPYLLRSKTYCLIFFRNRKKEALQLHTWSFFVLSHKEALIRTDIRKCNAKIEVAKSRAQYNKQLIKESSKNRNKFMIKIQVAKHNGTEKRSVCCT